MGTVNSKCGKNHFKHRHETKMLNGKVYVRLSVCNAVYARWGMSVSVTTFDIEETRDYNVHLHLLFLC